jgi:hypothetical protein
MEVYRLGDNLINVDGLNVYQPKRCEYWFAFNKKKIGTLRLQALYLYLHEEEKAQIQRFNKYVENIIDKLIYN